MFFNLNYLWGDWLDADKLKKASDHPFRLRTQSPTKKMKNEEANADLPEDKTYMTAKKQAVPNLQIEVGSPSR